MLFFARINSCWKDKNLNKYLFGLYQKSVCSYQKSDVYERNQTFCFLHSNLIPFFIASAICGSHDGVINDLKTSDFCYRIEELFLAIKLYVNLLKLLLANWPAIRNCENVCSTLSLFIDSKRPRKRGLLYSFNVSFSQFQYCSWPILHQMRHCIFYKN